LRLGLLFNSDLRKRGLGHACAAVPIDRRSDHALHCAPPIRKRAFPLSGNTRRRFDLVKIRNNDPAFLNRSLIPPD
jgi:hypothetical protein